MAKRVVAFIKVKWEGAEKSDQAKAVMKGKLCRKSENGFSFMNTKVNYFMDCAIDVQLLQHEHP